MTGFRNHWQGLQGKGSAVRKHKKADILVADWQLKTQGEQINRKRSIYEMVLRHSGSHLLRNLSGKMEEKILGDT